MNPQINGLLWQTCQHQGSGHKLVWFENRIWAIGGHDGNALRKVESYDPISDSWQTKHRSYL